MTLPHIALLLIAGFAGGFVNAIAGGGSLLVFPALLATGLGTVAANVTNSVALWPGYIGNLAGLGRAAVDEARARVDLALIAVLGAAVGAATLLVTPEGAFDFVVPILVIVASLLVGVQPVIARRIGAEQHRRPVALRVAVGVGSFYGGYFGGGLGVILLAAIGLTMAAPLREMNVLKAVLTMVVSTVSLLTFVFFAPVHWGDVAVIAPAALLGGVLGGRAARVVDERALRIAIVTFGLGIGLWLGIRVYA
ncbi:sulfite exporter TauE/SafE family protein [Jatrophihabitans sp. GAS493]|uniref:sulfite exporter TauE/SafE family protein n=1 Tax=Jatrophihabitans sp. GAS493 TaxID=1907575 RepID=UPI0018D59914|nr:sulfite exporter TauE/SafE family protein [Jatrophihabitans sp. GAS493]